MSLCGDNLVVVGCADQSIVAWDFRMGGEPLFQRPSTIKYQLRCLRAFNDGAGFVSSAIDGRCGVEYLDEAKGKPFSFKCHRVKLPDGKERITPVNALAFNPKVGTFVTGGGDGVVAAWDHISKKRLCVLSQHPTSIASLAYSGYVRRRCRGMRRVARKGAGAHTHTHTLWEHV